MADPNPQQFVKTPQQVKEQIERWYLKYHNTDYELVDPMGVFTLFDKVPSLKRDSVMQKLSLTGNELPVLILWINDDSFIVNTTHRFINVSDAFVSTISYEAFAHHAGYKSIVAFTKESKRAAVGVKSEGGYQEFGIRCRDGEIIYWIIPTGRPGFAFWNVTKKFDIIGRKYIISYPFSPTLLLSASSYTLTHKY